jgi:hypothetical protein
MGRSGTNATSRRMQASLAHDPTPRRSAAKLLEGWGGRRLAFHALEHGVVVGPVGSNTSCEESASRDGYVAKGAR